MIVSAILKFILTLINPILSLVPSITFQAQSIDGFMQYVRAILYFFPISTVTIIFSMFLGIQLFRIIIAFIRMFKTLIKWW